MKQIAEFVSILSEDLLLFTEDRYYQNNRICLILSSAEFVVGWDFDS